MLLLVYFTTASSLRARLRTIGLLPFIRLQAVSLQWANQRWITASELSKRIATEASMTDPASTVVLYIPDNLRGAHLFRNGLNEAATLFVGKETEVPYRAIVFHDVIAVDDVFEAKADSGTVTLSLPDNLREDIRYDVHELGFRVDRARWSVAVTDTSGVNPEIVSFLSFRSGTSNPILQMVRWDRQR